MSKKQITAEPEAFYSVWHLSLGIQLPSAFVLLLSQCFQLFVSCFLKADKSLCLLLSFKYNTKLLVCSKKTHSPSLVPPRHPDLNKGEPTHTVGICGDVGKGLEGKVYPPKNQEIGDLSTVSLSHHWQFNPGDKKTEKQLFKSFKESLL